LGRGKKEEYFFALVPIFARPNNEKCFRSAENPAETVATQATVALPLHIEEYWRTVEWVREQI